MRIDVDKEANALYLRLDDLKIIESEEVYPGVVLDFDENDRVIGIEMCYLPIQSYSFTEDIHLNYFQQEDVLHLTITKESEFFNVELVPNITVELSEQGEAIGIEFLKASTYLHDAIQDIVQGKKLTVRLLEKQ
jgi:uncharacterized protein YuzE